MFIEAQVIIARSWKQFRYPSTEEWIQKIYRNGTLLNGILLSYKKQ
jgi:hypothetical protein